MRRTLLLAGLVALGGALALVVRTPARRTGFYAVRGHRVFGVSGRAVRSLEVVLAGRRFSARRLDESWELDGRRASPAAAEAITDLVDALGGLRAVDAFRPRDASGYRLDRPRGTITLATGRGVRRLVLGDPNTPGSALYARREGDPRIAQIGTMILSEIERVFYARDLSPPPGPLGVCPSNHGERSERAGGREREAQRRPTRRA